MSKTFYAALVISILIVGSIVYYDYARNHKLVLDYNQSTALSQATLSDFWDGNARFKFQERFTLPTDGNKAWIAQNMGTDIVVRNNVWYMFTREYLPLETRPAHCVQDWSRIVVRNSTDKGKTWSAKTVIIEPQQGTFNECASIDGDAYFDDEENLWHYIYQCLDRSRIWNLCHATRFGSDPQGPFIQNGNNPVVKSGNVWNKILPGTSIGQEGTPEIVEKRDGFFYVTFHGYDKPLTYRGVARTLDFLNWEAVNTGPIFDKDDCRAWKGVSWDSGGCVGGGHATIMKEGSQYYMLIEAMDKDLACIPNQQWVFGMVRSSSLESQQWENIPSQPPPYFTTPAGTTQPCATQYARLFQDTNQEIYLVIGKIANNPSVDLDPRTGIYLYKLEKSLPERVGLTPEGRVDIPQPGVNVEKTLHISGWAVDKKGVQEVKVLVNGSIVGQATLGFARGDLAYIYPDFIGAANSGFSYDLNVSSLPPGVYVLSVQAESSDGRMGSLNTSPLQFFRTLPEATGYIMTSSDGGVFNLGSSQFKGSIQSVGATLGSPIRRVKNTSDENGYYLLGEDGGIFAFGNAQFQGSLPSRGISARAVDLELTQSTNGYYILGSDGNVFTFGDAQSFGTLPSVGVTNATVVDMTPTPSGKGYWILGSDGGVFSFGDAQFYGSLPSIGQEASGALHRIKPSITGKGYYVLAEDGGVFAFGDAEFQGSLPSRGIAAEAMDLEVDGRGRGYYILTSTGRVNSFGNIPNFGDLPINASNIVDMDLGDR